MRVNNASPERLSHLHNFRGLAILFIIATHCISVFDWAQSPVLRDVLARIVANGTVFFLFIAGYLFDHLSWKYRTGAYWATKIKFVVVPYLLASIPAILLFTLVLKRKGVRVDFYDQPQWLQIVEFLITGKHLAPFWFIPTIIVFYAFSPVLRFIFSHRKAYLALPFLFLVGAFVPRGNAFQSFVHFLPIWVLGMACSHFRAQADLLLRQVFWFVPLVIFGLFAAEMAWAPGTHSWYSDLQKAALALFLLEGLRQLGTRGDRYLGLAGVLSFGLFFVHSYVITAGKFFIARAFINKPVGNLFYLFLAAVIATLVTTFIVITIKKIAGHRSRFLIGI